MKTWADDGELARDSTLLPARLRGSDRQAGGPRSGLYRLHRRAQGVEPVHGALAGYFLGDQASELLPGRDDRDRAERDPDDCQRQ